MSSTLTWRPIEEYNGALPDALKFALRNSKKLPMEFGHAEIPYVQGLIDAGVSGASELLALIEEHGVVELKEEQ